MSDARKSRNIPAFRNPAPIQPLAYATIAQPWLDPALITKERQLYMDVDLKRGPGYGDTLSWTGPSTGVKLVHAQVDLDPPRFQKVFVNLMIR